MKKSTRWFILFTLLTLMVIATGTVASADSPAKGEVTFIDEGTGTVTVSTKNGEVVVTLPQDFDFTTVKLGDVLMAKGIWVSAAELTADWAKVFPAKSKDDVDDEDQDDDQDGEETDKEEKHFNSAYCNGQKDTFHPLAEKLAEKFGETTAVTADQVQAWYCEGNSIGAIMLALLTEEMGGPAAGESLAERNAGVSWGKIWQGLGFIGKEKDAMPPGLVKKEEGKIPPGQLKKTPAP